jgi:membrane-bound metal-dependent hydrolase YbcI (DUF457 family)
MFVGHYAVALIAKRAEPRINLGTLALAAMFADFAWCVFMIFGLEQVQFKSGMGAGKYFYATNIALSHSLLMDVIWATLLASAYFLRRRYRRGALMIFLVVLSHWLLDFVSWRPDLPIAPKLHRYVGLGLWNSIPATLLVEGGFWLVAVILYVRCTRSKSLMATFVFWGGIGLLSLLWFNNIAGPPPQNPKTAPFASLIVFSLTVAWAYWVNRVRVAGPTRV